MMTFACNILNLLLKSCLFQLYTLFPFLLLFFKLSLFYLSFLFLLLLLSHIFLLSLLPHFERMVTLFLQKVATFGFEGSNPFRCFSFKAEQVSGSLYKELRTYWFPLCFSWFGEENKRVLQRFLPPVCAKAFEASNLFSVAFFKIFHCEYLVLVLGLPLFCFPFGFLSSFRVFFILFWRFFVSILGVMGLSREIWSVSRWFFNHLGAETAFLDSFRSVEQPLKAVQASSSWGSMERSWLQRVLLIILECHVATNLILCKTGMKLLGSSA